MKAFALLALFVTSPAFALMPELRPAMADGKYSCTVSPVGADKAKVKIGFDLKEGEILCQKGDEEEGCEEWFTYSPKSQNKFWLDGLVDGGYGYTEKGDWEISADSDGCNIANLTLYRDSQFTKGFITTEFRCGSGETERHAGKVFCELK